VRRDDEGFYYVVDRKKDMYKSGGQNVYPAEVEKIIRSDPRVHDAAVIGIPDPKWGETGKAFVVLRTGESMSAGELQAHCALRLAKYKIPTEVAFVTELPKGETGKVLKRMLRSSQ
jgi:fatty-acyl-CoA synthase